LLGHSPFRSRVGSTSKKAANAYALRGRVWKEAGVLSFVDLVLVVDVDLDRDGDVDMSGERLRRAQSS
jgi:hypothetical protein